MQLRRAQLAAFLRIGLNCNCKRKQVSTSRVCALASSFGRTAGISLALGQPTAAAANVSSRERKLSVLRNHTSRPNDDAKSLNRASAFLPLSLSLCLSEVSGQDCSSCSTNRRANGEIVIILGPNISTGADATRFARPSKLTFAVLTATTTTEPKSERQWLSFSGHPLRVTRSESGRVC